MAVEITLDQIKEFSKNSDRKKNILEIQSKNKKIDWIYKNKIK